MSLWLALAATLWLATILVMMAHTIPMIVEELSITQ